MVCWASLGCPVLLGSSRQREMPGWGYLDMLLPPANNAGSTPRLSNELCALKGTWAPTVTSSLPPGHGAVAWKLYEVGNERAEGKHTHLVHTKGVQNWLNPSQRCFPLLNGVPKFLLLQLGTFGIP